MTARPETTHEDRLRQFFRFCDGLKAHPFFVVRVNFDEAHLEGLLVRLRQFLSERELRIRLPQEQTATTGSS